MFPRELIWEEVAPIHKIMKNTQRQVVCTYVETVFLKRNSAYSETVKGPCMCLSLKKLNLV